MASLNGAEEANGLHDELSYSDSTLAIHADDALNIGTDVAPPLHVATTFRYPDDPLSLKAESIEDIADVTKPIKHIYSRLTAPNTSRFEAILASLLHGYTLSYTSGLSAFHALLTFFRPNVIAIGAGYHGCHGVISIHQKLHNLKKVDLLDETAWDAVGLGKGDIVHIETPLNPTGEACDISKFAEMAHRRGAVLSVDATFGPPGLQDPFLWGADVVLHSGSKYFGGHSDMLCGVLAVKNREWFLGMLQERVYLGSVMGSLEGWLGVRSLRTMEIRVQRASHNAEALVKWIDGDLKAGDGVVGKTVERVQHASLQKEDLEKGWLKKQMPNGYGPVFALWMKRKEDAQRLPSLLKLFHHATSLGGVESLIEWRRMSDKGVDERLLRVSVGIENAEDLKKDLGMAFEVLAKEAKA